MPQHAKRVKIRRKDLRQPDEFETLTGQVVDWASENRPLLVAIASAVVLVVVAALVVGRWRASQRLAAHEDFRAAHAMFDASRWQEASNGFEQLATDYPRTPMGQLAIMYRGHTLMRTGDYQGAITAYGEYLITSPESPIFRQEALVNLAQAKEATEDGAGALESYGQAAALDGPFQVEARLGEARLREAAGETDRAREIYASLLKEGPDPDLQAFLVSKLPPGSAATAPAPAEASAEDIEVPVAVENDAAAP